MLRLAGVTARVGAAWRNSLPFRAFAIWAGVFVLYSVIHIGESDLPYYWDAVGYVFYHSLDIHSNGLNPVLVSYDVGHPSGFYFQIALWMKLVGIGPLAGHLATWAWVAVLPLAVYGWMRIYEVPPGVSVGTAVLTMIFPLIYAQSLQVLLDLPLAIAMMASYWCWLRGRWWGWFVFGSAACLMKLYGFLVVGPTLGALFCTGFRKDAGGWRAFFRELWWTITPWVALGYFMLIRYIVRGPGLTVNHTTGNTMQPVWEWEEWLEYVPFAANMLFVWNFVGVLLAACVVAWLLRGAAAAVGLRARLPAEGRLARLRGGLVLIFMMVGLNFAFFQLHGLCGRYNLPTAMALIILTFVALYRSVLWRPAIYSIQVIVALLFLLFWHPRLVEKLPLALQPSFSRGEVREAYLLENDLRFKEVIKLIRWGYDEIIDDAGGLEHVTGVATRWPITVALMDPRLGYVPERMECHSATFWEDIDAEQSPYVLVIEPLCHYVKDPYPAELFGGFWLVAERERYGVNARIIKVLPRDEPTSPGLSLSAPP